MRGGRCDFRVKNNDDVIELMKLHIQRKADFLIKRNHVSVSITSEIIINSTEICRDTRVTADTDINIPAKLSTNYPNATGIHLYG